LFWFPGLSKGRPGFLSDNPWAFDVPVFSYLDGVGQHVYGLRLYAPEVVSCIPSPVVVEVFDKSQPVSAGAQVPEHISAFRMNDFFLQHIFIEVEQLQDVLQAVDWHGHFHEDVAVIFLRCGGKPRCKGIVG